ncbi:MAG: hypothetical protein JXA20_13270 [Spirochaetes bacterium]|nr:hypothetical protein [Spirochaetota bacterium]
MKCDDAILRFMELDNRETLPLRVRFHMLRCRHCRQEIRSLRRILDEQLGASPFMLERDLSAPLQSYLRQSEVSYHREISYVKWLSVGVVILSGRILVTFSDTLAWLQDRFGSSLDIPLNIVLGLALSIYALCFIGTHIDELKKTIDLYFK